MQFHPLSIAGAFYITPKRHQDARGFFSRLYCKEQFLEHGIEEDFIQTNHSYSAQKGTLRGMHYQLSPSEEGKLVTCIAGTLWDCLIDLRPSSPTYGKWFGMVLSAETGTLLYVPKGTAHGFITLEDNSQLLYQVTTAYDPQCERGVRWNDPTFAIKWPIEPTLISPRDEQHPDFSPIFSTSQAR